MGDIETFALKVDKSEALETRIEKETRQSHPDSIETNVIGVQAQKHGSN